MNYEQFDLIVSQIRMLSSPTNNSGTTDIV